MDPSEVQEQAREGSTSQIRTQVQIQDCPRRQKWNLVISQWDTLITAILGLKLCLSGSGSSMEVLCYVRVDENAS
jgi:homoserine kinase